MAKKILVVDDAPSIIQLMEYWLSRAGYEIIVAQNGVDGFELAKKEKPDLIILDIMIPKLDGASVCRLLKHDKQYRHIPIIIVTAREEGDKGLEADVYIQKPVEEQVLLDKIKGLIKN